ncbi:MAG: hypothetical protein E7666_09320 [Ruminococcaceae bacterium]|nr:hypothetical protein [Oscillospiraceae bacterium]
MNLRLAEVARAEAKKNYHGDTDAAISNLQPIAEVFSVADGITLASLDRDWSGAFVFFCTERAEMGLPIRYPDPRVRGCFAYVEAWEDYARLPKIGLWRPVSEQPEEGDLVIFEPEAGKAPLMGIVTTVNDTCMEVAVGNYRNHSALIERPLCAHVRGWIRIAD